jgi:hypothetical protein
LPIAVGLSHEHADAPYAVGLLRPRHEWPRRRAAEPRDELSPQHQRSPMAGSTAYRGLALTQSFLQRGRLLAGRDGFWLARWLRSRDVEIYVIHPTSIADRGEHRRAKTDRLDTELLMRAFLGWLRGEPRHCSMVAIPTIRWRLFVENCRRFVASPWARHAAELDST